jgi:4-hydroxy-tetrahydrodipicolinate synthase
MKSFTGVMTPLLVPLNDQEEVIEPELRTHINNLIEQGIHGFLSPSATGEFANLSNEEWEKVLQITVNETSGRIPVIALVTECGTKNTLRNIKIAMESGADAVMATTPYYYPLDQPSVLNYFTTLADESELPLWLYHQPNDTKLSIEHDTLLKLSKHPNITGIKISTNDMLFYYRAVRLFDRSNAFSVLMAEDHSFLPALSLGGEGVVSFISNIIPGTVIDLWEAINDNNSKKAMSAQTMIMDCFEAFFTLENNNPICACKLLLRERGVFSSELTTDPLPVLTDREKQILIKRAKNLNLLV